MVKTEEQGFSLGFALKDWMDAVILLSTYAVFGFAILKFGVQSLDVDKELVSLVLFAFMFTLFLPISLILLAKRIQGEIKGFVWNLYVILFCSVTVGTGLIVASEIGLL